MTFKEKLDVKFPGIGWKLERDVARWARQETLREVIADVQEMKNILEYGETGILTSLHLRIKLLLKKLEAEREQQT